MWPEQRTWFNKDFPRLNRVVKGDTMDMAVRVTVDLVVATVVTARVTMHAVDIVEDAEKVSMPVAAAKVEAPNMMAIQDMMDKQAVTAAIRTQGLVTPDMDIATLAVAVISKQGRDLAVAEKATVVAMVLLVVEAGQMEEAALARAPWAAPSVGITAMVAVPLKAVEMVAVMVQVVDLVVVAMTITDLEDAVDQDPVMAATATTARDVAVGLQTGLRVLRIPLTAEFRVAVAVMDTVDLDVVAGQEILGPTVLKTLQATDVQVLAVET